MAQEKCVSPWLDFRTIQGCLARARTTAKPMERVRRRFSSCICTLLTLGPVLCSNVVYNVSMST